jgi:hypothetical protein
MSHYGDRAKVTRSRAGGNSRPVRWGTAARSAAFLVLLVHPNRRENAMCYSRDYWIFEQKKAEETRARQERRAGVVDKMLDDANKQGERSKDAAPVTDVAPAK